ncbi:MAG: hypothetical protein ACYC8T_37405 [Myxococcaceae bacterium]
MLVHAALVARQHFPLPPSLTEQFWEQHWDACPHPLPSGEQQCPASHWLNETQQSAQLSHLPAGGEQAQLPAVQLPLQHSPASAHELPCVAQQLPRRHRVPLQHSWLEAQGAAFGLQQLSNWQESPVQQPCWVQASVNWLQHCPLWHWPRQQSTVVEHTPSPLQHFPAQYPESQSSGAWKLHAAPFGSGCPQVRVWFRHRSGAQHVRNARLHASPEAGQQSEPPPASRHCPLQQSVPSAHDSLPGRQVAGRHWPERQTNPEQHSGSPPQATPSLAHSHRKSPGPLCLHWRGAQHWAESEHASAFGRHPSTQTLASHFCSAQQFDEDQQYSPLIRQAVQRPPEQLLEPQHSLCDAQVSPSVLQFGASQRPDWHCSPSQHSAPKMHGLDFAVHPDGAPHLPASQVPLQHCAEKLQPSVGGRHPGWHELSTHR